MRLPAANLHDLPWPRRNGVNLPRHPLGDLAVPKLGQVLHWLEQFPCGRLTLGAPGPAFGTWDTMNLN